MVANKPFKGKIIKEDQNQIKSTVINGVIIYIKKEKKN